MEKRKRWQFFLILGVLFLTVYNILPTIFYYSNPLRDPINESRAERVVDSIVDRVNDLEDESVSWLWAYCKHLTLKPQSIKVEEANPKFITVTFSNSEETEVLRKFLPKAGALIPLAPAQLQLAKEDEDAYAVKVERQIGLHLDPQSSEQFFTFAPKFLEDGQVSDAYRTLVYDRVLEAGEAIAGVSRLGQHAELVLAPEMADQSVDALLALSKEISDVYKHFGAESPITKRFLASVAQVNDLSPSQVVTQLGARAETVRQQLENNKKDILEEQERLQEEGLFLDPTKEQMLEVMACY